MKVYSLTSNTKMWVFYAIVIIVPYLVLSIKNGLICVLTTAGVGLITHAMSSSSTLQMSMVVVTMALMIGLFKMGALKEGFNTRTASTEVAGLLRSMKKDYSGSQVEGYEDIKKDKNETPAPAMKKDELPQPFKLGEIPAQIKNGPHIDAGSTLMKAVQSLNPDQINAMTKDTQQLIETQKSLMGMLGTMKPMLNDGKQLMDTFQEMFGQ